MLKIIGIIILSAIIQTGCSTPRLVNGQTAEVKFASLSPGGKAVASEFYSLGQGDAMKRLYWAQRRQQEQGRDAAELASADKVELKRELITVPVPAFQEPNGTIKEESTQVLEVVE